ncbi:hypothetical protein [Brevundimonas sp.]|uniref:hypothetical protein n=1 Tax=Brevundimonas sp. TaxID=1871086 RepID=UPI0028A85310|nr:hypothetical protein [Brevundimonas sp.]
MRLLSKALAVGGVGLALTGSTALSPLPASRPGTLNAICGPAAGGALARALADRLGGRRPAGQAQTRQAQTNWTLFFNAGPAPLAARRLRPLTWRLMRRHPDAI